MLSRIAMGKFARAEYSSMLNATDEKLLRDVATNSMLRLLINLNKFLESKNSKLQVNEGKNSENTQNMMNYQSKGPKSKKNGALEKNIVNLEPEIEGNVINNLEKAKQRKVMIKDAVAKFNFKIKHGMKAFLELGVIKMEAKSIANFFYDTKALSRDKLGEYFGEEDDFNLNVLSEFVVKMSFVGLGICDALRQFLHRFDLPGEGQKIERILQKFVDKFTVDCEGVIDVDGGYLLTYLVIMLHTNRYNANVIEKMKLSEFVKLGKGI